MLLTGVGFTNGYVYILDSLTLDDEVPEPFRYSRDAVTHCTFSLDSKWMATAVSIAQDYFGFDSAWQDTLSNAAVKC